MRRILFSIVLGLPLCGSGCAGAPETPDEPEADLSAVRAAIAAARPSGTPPTFTALPDPHTPGIGGNALQFTTINPPGSSRTPGTISRESVFGRPAAYATDEQAPAPAATRPSTPPPAAPAPTSSARKVGRLRGLFGSSSVSSPSVDASSSFASPSPASLSPATPDASSSSFRLNRRQKLHEKLP